MIFLNLMTALAVTAVLICIWIAFNYCHYQAYEKKVRGLLNLSGCPLFCFDICHNQYRLKYSPEMAAKEICLEHQWVGIQNELVADSEKRKAQK